MNSFFDHIYLINLRKKPDRLVKVLNRLYRLGIEVEVIEAIDGYISPYINNYKKYIHNCDFIFKNISKKRRIPNAGAWGYLLSWKKVLLDAIENGYQNFLCFDDDVLFDKDFVNKFPSFITNVTKHNRTFFDTGHSWKIINLGATQHHFFHKEKENTNINNEDLEAIFRKQEFYFPNKTDGSFATAVHKSIYNDLLKEIEPMDYPFDSGALRTIYQRYPQQCYVAYPNLIVADVTDSTIRGKRNQLTIAKKVGWDMTNFNFPFSWKNDTALVTVIICAFNAEKTIQSSIRSIIYQTYKNIEIIVVDDFSHDSTVEKVENLIKALDHTNLDDTSDEISITLLKNTENIGCYRSRNKALKIAKGDFITFHDADDYSLSERIEKQVIAILRYRVLFVSCLIIRSHLPNFDLLDFDKLNNGCKADKIGKIADKILLTGVRHHRTHIKQNNQYEYCCKAILGMVTPLFHKQVFGKLGLYLKLRCIADAEYCERVLYHYSNKQIEFSGEESVVSFLSKKDYIPKLYYKVKEVLYISEEMDQNNITTRYKGKSEYLRNLRENWRKKLKTTNF